MTIRIVVTSDWHLDAITNGKRRHDEIADAILQSIEFARKVKADYYFMLGDLCNPDNVRSYLALSQARSLLSWLGDSYVVLLTGNHDVIEDGSGHHTLMPLYDPNSIHIVNSPSVIGGIDDSDEFLNIVCLPFTPSSYSYDPVEFIESKHKEIDQKYPTVVLGHLNIGGITPGSESIDMPRGRDVFLPIDTIRQYIPDAFIFNGHYHKQQVFNGVYVPGSAARLTFGEAENELGFLYLEI